MQGTALQWSGSVGRVTCTFAQKATVLQFWKLYGTQWPKQDPSEVNVMLWKTECGGLFFFFPTGFITLCFMCFFFLIVLVFSKRL